MNKFEKLTNNIIAGFPILFAIMFILFAVVFLWDISDESEYCRDSMHKLDTTENPTCDRYAKGKISQIENVNYLVCTCEK